MHGNLSSSSLFSQYLTDLVLSNIGMQIARGDYFFFLIFEIINI